MYTSKRFENFRNIDRRCLMARYHLTLRNPSEARGPEPSLSFRSVGADGFAEELQQALREDALFQRWRAMQPDPDEVDPELGRVDPTARVTGEQRDLSIELDAVTDLPGSILRHRMRLLAGSAWTLNDVTRD